MAVRLGRVNVDAMLRSLTHKQFIEWEQYAKIEPIGEMREDARAALIASTVYNMAVDPNHRKGPDDPMFQIKWVEKRIDGKPTQDQFAVMKVLAAAFSADSEPTRQERAADDKISADMRAQVEKAHAAMKLVKGDS